MEPPISVPISNEVKPIATAAAAPPEEPPGPQERSQGLLVVPNISLYDWISPDQRGRLVYPSLSPLPFATKRPPQRLDRGRCLVAQSPPCRSKVPCFEASLTVIGIMESAYRFAPLSLLISIVCFFQRDFEITRHYSIDLWVQTLNSLYKCSVSSTESSPLRTNSVCSSVDRSPISVMEIAPYPSSPTNKENLPLLGFGDDRHLCKNET